MIRVAQLLLVLAAGALWVASRLTWVSVTAFDGLSPPRTSTLSGAEWSTALLPLALLLLTAALAALAVRGWLLRVLALLVDLACFALGYLGISLIVMPDVGPRGAELAGVQIVNLVASQRYIAGAVLTTVAAVGALFAAVLLMRSAVSSAHEARKYAAPGASGATVATAMSERGMWDALDEGHDPTHGGIGAPGSPGSDAEGR